LSSISSLSSFALAELERVGDWVRLVSFSSCVPFNLPEIGSVARLVDEDNGGGVGVVVGAKVFVFRVGAVVRGIVFGSVGVVVGAEVSAFRVGAVVRGIVFGSVGVVVGAEVSAFRVGAAVGGIVFGSVGVVVGAEVSAFRVGAAVGGIIFGGRLDGRSDGANVDSGSVGMMVLTLTLTLTLTLLLLLLLLLGAVVTASGLKEIGLPAKASSVTCDCVGVVVSTEEVGSSEMLELVEVSVFVPFRVII
jgi:hypothetical protein